MPNIYRVLSVLSVLSWLVLMVACNCILCLGNEYGQSRQTVWRHQRERGLATVSQLQQELLRRESGITDGDEDHWHRGDLDEDGGNDGPDEPDEAVDWTQDPFYPIFRDYFAELVGDI
jgi:hypothetical protein